MDTTEEEHLFQHQEWISQNFHRLDNLVSKLTKVRQHCKCCWWLQLHDADRLLAMLSFSHLLEMLLFSHLLPAAVAGKHWPDPPSCFFALEPDFAAWAPFQSAGCQFEPADCQVPVWFSPRSTAGTSSPCSGNPVCSQLAPPATGKLGMFRKKKLPPLENLRHGSTCDTSLILKNFKNLSSSL